MSWSLLCLTPPSSIGEPSDIPVVDRGREGSEYRFDQ
jgi:hypothetical protein